MNGLLTNDILLQAGMNLAAIMTITGLVLVVTAIIPLLRSPGWKTMGPMGRLFCIGVIISGIAWLPLFLYVDPDNWTTVRRGADIRTIAFVFMLMSLVAALLTHLIVDRQPPQKN